MALAVGVSFVCSILEAVILSISPSFVSLSLDNKKSFAPILRDFKDDIDKPLTAILTLNTIANTFGAAGVGAQAQILYGNEVVTAVSAIITLSILIFSEIIPKTLGAIYWRQLAGVCTYILKGLVFILTPVVWIMNQITKIFKGSDSKSTFSKYEITAITEMGEEQGVLHEDESKIIKNLLQFENILTEDIMTPRTVAVVIEENEPIKEFLKNQKSRHFSRMPVYLENKDEITGYVLKDDLLFKMFEESGEDIIKSCIRPVEKVNEHLPLPELYRLLTEKNEHIAVVVDDYDGFAGIVTMEDVIETLLGIEITDESDEIEDLQKFARKNWEYRAKKLGIINTDDEDKE